MSAAAEDLPSPDTCLSITEHMIDLGGGIDGSRFAIHLEFTNVCDTPLLLHIAFVHQIHGTATGELYDIYRIPGNGSPEQDERYGSILQPGGSTLYPAYGPEQDVYGNWQNTWGVCAQYYPEAVHEATGYATCEASYIPEYYWGCADGTPYPSGVDKDDRYSDADFCNDRDGLK